MATHESESKQLSMAPDTIRHLTVAVIIPALNEERYIGDCLDSLTRLDGGDAVVDVVVVDNGSIDRTAAIALQHGARVVGSPRSSIGALRNIGARSTQSEILAFLDADCTARPDWLTNAARCIRQTGAAIVGSTHLIPPDASWIARAAHLATMHKVGEVNYVPSGNMVVMRAAFDAVGGFNEALQTNEDVEFCQRAVRQGHLLRADPSISAVHHGIPHGLFEFTRREIWHGMGSFPLFFQDLRAVTNARVVPYAIFFAIIIVGATAGLLQLIFGGAGTALIAVGLALAATTLWLVFWHVGVRRRGWPLVVAWMLLYGLARGLSFLVYLATRWLPRDSPWRGPRRGRAADRAQR